MVKRKGLEKQNNSCNTKINFNYNASLSCFSTIDATGHRNSYQVFLDACKQGQMNRILESDLACA